MSQLAVVCRNKVHVEFKEEEEFITIKSYSVATLLKKSVKKTVATFFTLSRH